MAGKVTEAAVVGGVDTHKDLHVAAVVGQNNKVLGTQFFSTTRQGYGSYSSMLLPLRRYNHFSGAADKL